MKKINIENKGILSPENEIKIFGKNLIYLQIIKGVIKEKRFIESLWGGYCFIRYPTSNLVNYTENLSKVINVEFIKFGFDNFDFLTRKVVSNQHSIICGEYGSPGARILYLNECLRKPKVYDPYIKDPGIYHIHDVLPLEGDRYLVSTGDSNKYLDEMIINEYSCKILKRHLRHLGGFTASISIGNRVILGTDFSYRPNYLMDFYSGDKYFLPKQVWLEYIIDIKLLEPSTLVITTKKLNQPEGHIVNFCLMKNIFYSAEKVTIRESIVTKQLGDYINHETF